MSPMINEFWRAHARIFLKLHKCLRGERNWLISTWSWKYHSIMTDWRMRQWMGVPGITKARNYTSIPMYYEFLCERYHHHNTHAYPQNLESQRVVNKKLSPVVFDVDSTLDPTFSRSLTLSQCRSADRQPLTNYTSRSRSGMELESPDPGDSPSTRTLPTWPPWPRDKADLSQIRSACGHSEKRLR